MRFKEFLLNEGGFDDSGSDWFYGSMLLPSDAPDWTYAQPYPGDFKFLQSRWEKERKQGRKFHNLDLDGVLNTKFVGVYSNTMPEPGEGGWKHRPDTRPNLKIDFDAPMELQGHKKRADVYSVLTKSNDLLDMKEKLNKTFGKFEPKYAELSKDFDEPWVNKTRRKSK